VTFIEIVEITFLAVPSMTPIRAKMIPIEAIAMACNTAVAALTKMSPNGSAGILVDGASII
jgi:hypothetical protein